MMLTVFFLSFQVTIFDEKLEENKKIKKSVSLEAGKDFFYLWVLLCVIRPPYWETLLSHQEQTKGSYPVWVILCVF